MVKMEANFICEAQVAGGTAMLTTLTNN